MRISRPRILRQPSTLTIQSGVLKSPSWLGQRCRPDLWHVSAYDLDVADAAVSLGQVLVQGSLKRGSVGDHASGL